MKRFAFVLLSLVATTLGLVPAPPIAHANGTETLGTPSIPIQGGTGVAIGGVGMAGVTTGTLNVAVPSGVTVKQVLLYWSGLHPRANNFGDNNITVNGVPTPGTRVGGPAFFFGTTSASAFRADITARGIVGPGANTLNIAGMGFASGNDGVGITVIYDGGTTPATIKLTDGVDLAYDGFSAPRKTTIPQTYTFPASIAPRTANLVLHVGDVGVSRPHQIVITVGGVPTILHSPLGDTSGREWDSPSIPVTIPAGATTASVQILSNNDGTSLQPASIIWVAAGLAVPPPVSCLPSANPASAGGRAYGVQASLLDGAINIPATPDTHVANPDQLATLAVPPGSPVVADTLLQVVNDPVVGATSAADTALAVTNALDVAGVVQASTVVARSVSTADGLSAGSSSDGSMVQDLVINGTPVGDVSHPQTHQVLDPSTGNVVVQVDVLEKIPTGAAAGVVQPEGATSLLAGDYRSGLTVNALHVRTFDPLLGVLINDVVIGHAESSVSFPSARSCTPQPHVAGRAFTTQVGNVDPNIAASTTGLVTLPSTGGHESANVANLPPLGIGTGNTDTQGTLTPLEARSLAETSGFDLLSGAIVGQVIRAETSSDSVGDTGNAIIANLILAGTDVCAALSLAAICTPPPNTPLLPAPFDTVVILNEQIVGGGGMTVNAVHIYIVGNGNPFGLPAGAEVIISSAFSAATP